MHRQASLLAGWRLDLPSSLPLVGRRHRRLRLHISSRNNNTQQALRPTTSTMPPRLRSAARKQEGGAEEEKEAENSKASSSLIGKAAALYRAYEPLGWEIVPWLLVALDLLLSVVIVKRVAYTEIDWVAYMQEVAGFLEKGETDYLKLRGDTGPLVYPGGFVWLFSALYYVTDKGTDIRLAQWIFVGIYLLTLALVLLVYRKAKLAPLWALPCLILSKRVHSIFVLRMFNDGAAMAFLYLALLLLMHRKYPPACVAYSLAVSVKMNVLLFAPGLGLVLVQALGWPLAAAHILLCGAVQLLVAYPFLYDHPVSYLTKAFELSRVFEYQWTVNFRFLSEKAFLSKPLALSLLLATLTALAFLLLKWLRQPQCPHPLIPQRIETKRGLSPRYVALTLMASNFVGVVFARTLHYQFYAWYFHALPALCFHTPALFPESLGPLRLLPLLGIEYAFNVFPSTAVSSLVLQACHLWLLLSLFLSPPPCPIDDSADDRRVTKKQQLR